MFFTLSLIQRRPAILPRRPWAGNPGFAIRVAGDLSFRLTEFPDVHGKNVYFRLPERKGELAELWKRGITPRIRLPGDYGVDPKQIDQAVAEAKAVADAGLPVNIQLFGGLDLYTLEDGRILRHPDMPDMKNVKNVWDLPCITIKDGWKHRADHLRSLYEKFVDAKIPVAAVWFDYEGPPYPWNG